MIWEILLIYTLLELFEIQWQKGSSLRVILEKLYSMYTKSSPLFFVMHPTFIVALGLAVVYNFTLPVLMLLSLKAIDIVTKLVLMQKLFMSSEQHIPTDSMLDMPIKPYMPYLNLFIYLPIVLVIVTDSTLF